MQSYVTLNIHLKPWKNKASVFVVVYKTNLPVDKFIADTIQSMKETGLYKRRVVTGYTFGQNLNIKL